MIIVVPFTQKYNETDEHGRIILKKGSYVDYGINAETGEGVCLPIEPFNRFVKENCYFNNDLHEWVLK
jgi:hypothetical protein